MGASMDHTLVKPNKLCAYIMTVQDKPFAEAPFCISTENHDYMVPLSSKWTVLGNTTRNPAEQELQTCPEVTCMLAHEWDPQNVCFHKSLRNVEEEISSNIGVVMNEGGSPDLTNIDSDNDSVDHIYNIAAMTRLMIESIKVDLITSSIV